MKTITSILSSTVFAGVLSIGTLASMPSASAQALAQADIPFAFHAGNASMPSGKYTLIRESNVTYLLRGPGSAAALIQMRPESSTKDHAPVMVFNRYGDHYFFSQVWNGHEGIECPKTRSEREAVKASQVVSSNSTSGGGTVAVALNKTPQQ